MTTADLKFRYKYRDELRRAILGLIGDPTSSESISTPNGGSRSVTYHSLASLQSELRLVEAEIATAEASRRRRGLGVNYARWC